MKKNKIKKEFLNKLEFFYRNLGSIWSVEDFTNNRDVQSLLKDYLYYPTNICTFAMLEPAKPLNDAQMCGSFFNII